MQSALDPSGLPMRLRLPALLAVTAITATACLDPLPVPQGRYGAITASAYAVQNGFFVLRPEAAFYGNTDLSYVPFQNDTCFVTPFSPTSTVIDGSLRFLNAGDYVQTQVAGRVDSLFPIPGISLRVYQRTQSQGIPYTPGDTLRVVFPGATFPAGALSVRTAEGFTHDTIIVPATGAGLPLTWTTTPAGGSQMTVSLRYNNGFQTTGLNEQVFCSLIDDGNATIPTAYLDGWRQALNDERQTRMARVRSSEVVLDQRTRVTLISSFSRPILIRSAADTSTASLMAPLP